jgi:DMSO/TMAO reductase YedYZ molybdopterin-dependent catalytic subunit
MTRQLSRRRLLAGLGLAASAPLLSACDRLGRSPAFRSFLTLGEKLAYRVHRLIGRSALATEYPESQLSPVFRTNGNTRPKSGEYQRHASEGFARWQLTIDGLVDAPQSLSLAALRQMPSRTQITRHDCVEGWSAIGKWTGVPLRALLERAQLQPEARFIVFHCADDFHGTPYYESIDLVDAFHPQTILAYAMNGKALPMGHGAPLRLRVERQLGYKHAKFVMRVEAVRSLAEVGEGRGGYWEDQGFYDWYAGI